MTRRSRSLFAATHASARRLSSGSAVLVLAVGAVLTTVVLPPVPAHAFGTTRSQGSEHEFITRAALACPPGVPSDGSCFEPMSLDQLAGRPGTFGGVGAPDSDEFFGVPQAHCDDADFLAVAGYPRSRAAATAQLQACVTHLRGRFEQGVTAAAAVLKADGTLDGEQVDIRSSCTFFGGVGGRAKCDAIEGLGRALHGVQDFYSHSNYADEADPGRPIGLANPPGLNLPAPSALLDLRGTGFAPVPPDLSTGHFSTLELVLSCDRAASVTGRVTHKCLNKDEEQIDPASGAVAPCATGTVACTVRGAVGSNAAKAVAGAITETRRQWADFRAELLSRYGPENGTRIVSALTQDVPRLDLVFVVDTTGSMFDDIAAVQAAATSLVDSVSTDTDLVDYRIAVVDYKDLYADCPGDGYASRVDLNFSTASDKAAILAAIGALGASGGCDLPESVYSGVMSALGLTWRAGAQKAVIVMGDAPPHDPEPVTGHTLGSVLAAAAAVDPALIYTVEIAGGAGSSFEQLAAGSGGKHFDAANAAEVVTGLRGAIEDVRLSPTADAGGPYSAEVAEPVTFDGSRSTDPDGTLISYEWDFESDGTIDATGPGATATHSYPAAFTGEVTLRVTDDDGRRHSARAPVTIGSNAAPVAVAGGPYTATLGDPVTFDGSGSADADGRIVEYGWDVDSDGSEEVALPTPTLTYAYPAPFTGQVTLRVTDDRGRSTRATAAVTVRPAATETWAVALRVHGRAAFRADYQIAEPVVIGPPNRPRTVTITSLPGTPVFHARLDRRHGAMFRGTVIAQRPGGRLTRLTVQGHYRNGRFTGVGYVRGHHRTGLTFTVTHTTR